jgi:hypothetical protein
MLTAEKVSPTLGGPRLVAEILIKLAVMYEATGRLAQAHSMQRQARERLDQSRLLQAPLDSLQDGRLVYRCDIDQMEPSLKWAHMVLNAFCDASQAWRGLGLRRLQMADFQNKVSGGLADLAALYHRVGPSILETDDALDPFHQEHFAYFQYNFGLACESIGLANQAVEAYGKAVSLFEPLVREYPAVREYRIGLSLSRSRMGQMVWHVHSNSHRRKRYLCNGTV